MEGSSLQAEGPQKRALVVAIGNYPGSQHVRDTGQSTRSMTFPLIATSLQNQGFPDTNVRLLQDRDADRDGILSAMNDLIERAGSGDVIVFHLFGTWRSVDR